MEEEFRLGYVVGVSDTVSILMAIGFAIDPDISDPLLEQATVAKVIRYAHQCIISKPFSTVKDATAFASDAISGLSDAQASAAFVFVRALSVCGNPDGATLFARAEGAAKKNNGFTWKDRWDRAPSSIREGYVSGLTDILQYLDNSGKTQSVLYGDVLKFVGCQDYKLNLNTGRQLLTYAHKAIEHQGNDDPLASTSGVLFNTLVGCKNL